MIAIESSEHVANKAAFVAEAVRVLRIWCAYAVGAMRYGIFTARRE